MIKMGFVTSAELEASKKETEAAKKRIIEVETFMDAVMGNDDTPPVPGQPPVDTSSLDPLATARAFASCGECTEERTPRAKFASTADENENEQSSYTDWFKDETPSTASKTTVSRDPDGKVRSGDGFVRVGEEDHAYSFSDVLLPDTQQSGGLTSFNIKYPKGSRPTEDKEKRGFIASEELDDPIFDQRLRTESSSSLHCNRGPSLNKLGRNWKIFPI